MLATALGFVAAAAPESPPTAIQPSWGAPASSRGGSSSNAVRWIHIPKTGSSFGSTIYRHGCTGIDDTTYITGDDYPIKEFTHKYPPSLHCVGGLAQIYKIDGHQPTLPNQNALVTLFREPTSIKKSFLDFTIQEQRFKWARGDTDTNASTFNFYKSMLEVCIHF